MSPSDNRAFFNLFVTYGGHKLGQTDHKGQVDFWGHKVGHGDL